MIKGEISKMLVDFKRKYKDLIAFFTYDSV